jgi:hypothetical protein
MFSASTRIRTISRNYSEIMLWTGLEPTATTGGFRSDTGPTRLLAARGNFGGAEPNAISDRRSRRSNAFIPGQRRSPLTGIRVPLPRAKNVTNSD